MVDTAASASTSAGNIIDPVEIISAEGLRNPATELAEVELLIQETAANSIIKNHIIASLGLGLVPIPLFDLSALTAVQLNLLQRLGAHYGVTIKEYQLKPILLALLSGTLPVMTIMGLSSVAKVLPGIGSLAGSAGVSLLAGAVTYALGQTFMLHFEAGGTLDDFDPKHMQTFFQRELAAGKAVVQGIRDEIKGTRPQAETTKTGFQKGNG